LDEAQPAEAATAAAAPKQKARARCQPGQIGIGVLSALCGFQRVQAEAINRLRQVKTGTAAERAEERAGRFHGLGFHLMVGQRHNEPWKHWYDLAVWRKRARHQLLIEPMCRICAQHGEASIATVVDHVAPHGGNWNLFRLGKVQSLCQSCHDGAKRFEEIRGFSDRIGVDGMPVDPRHPFYSGKAP